MGNRVIEAAEIAMKYRSRNGERGERQFSANDFFEIDDSSGDVSSIRDLVWQHAHASEYLGFEPNQLVETTIELVCPPTRERIRDVELFWDDGRCRTIFRQEFVNDVEVYWIRIVEIGTSHGTHFIRFGSESNEACELLEHHLLFPGDEVQFLFPGEK